MPKCVYLRIASICCITFLSFYSAGSEAATFMEVFRDALNNDPTFKQAEAQWEVTKQELPLALAALLPQVNASSNLNLFHLHNNVNSNVVQSGTYTNQFYGISLQQPIFNASLWWQLTSANATVKAATAAYSSAFQDLMVRNTQAYLNVLQAYDALRYTIANEKATYRQLVSEEQKFKVGLVAITDVYDAQSQYDAIVAAEIAQRNNLDIQLEELQAITSHYYTALAGLGDKGVPLFPPEPTDINAWVKVAGRQNYSILAQQYTTRAAYHNIQANAANHLPTVTLQSAYQKEINIDQPIDVDPVTNSQVTSDANQETSSVGLAINMPVFSGGAIVAATRQARYQYANQVATLEFLYRQVASNTRQAYLGVLLSVSKIQADVQAIKSAANSVGSTEEGYKVGTRTIVDLLQALTQLYQQQQQLAVDQYNYINNYVALKNQAGTLSIDDLRRINGWLNKMINFTGEYAPTRVRMAQGELTYKFATREVRIGAPVAPASDYNSQTVQPQQQVPTPPQTPGVNALPPAIPSIGDSNVNTPSTPSTISSGTSVPVNVSVAGTTNQLQTQAAQNTVDQKTLANVDVPQTTTQQNGKTSPTPINSTEPLPNLKPLPLDKEEPKETIKIVIPNPNQTDSDKKPEIKLIIPNPSQSKTDDTNEKNNLKSNENQTDPTTLSSIADNNTLPSPTTTETEKPQNKLKSLFHKISNIFKSSD